MELTTQIKEVVIRNGVSVKGKYLRAIYSKGRKTWDTKAMEGSALAHPEINKFKKTGQPSISIREVKGEKVD